MSYKQPSYLKQIWWTIKWAFTRNKRVATPPVTEVKEPQYAFPPMDLRLKDGFAEDLSDGALD